jgi:hypothetical protein
MGSGSRTKRQQAHACPIRFNRDQSASFKLRSENPQRCDHGLAEPFYRDILASDLDNAWLFSARYGENCPEVEIVGQHDIFVSSCLGHHFGIRSVWPTDVWISAGLPTRESRRSLSHLYDLLAPDRISVRRASTLAYISILRDEFSDRL